MLDTSEYLFPKMLRKTETKFDSCLFIGSCLVGDSIANYRHWYPETNIDYIIFNNFSDLPESPPRPIQEYDFQLIQLPLRHVLSDAVVFFKKYSTGAFSDELIENALTSLRLMLDAAMKYAKTGGVLTLVSNFVVPTAPAVAGLANRNTGKDLAFVVRLLNDEIARIVSTYPNTYLIDFETMAGAIGKRYFLNDSIVFFGHNGYWFDDWNNNEVGRIETLPHITEISPSHTHDFMRAIWSHAEYLYRIVNQIDMVKLVIFDLDDTLWRGLIADQYGDDVVETPMWYGWPLGLSEAIQHLRARGILTAICSKNSDKVVIDRWHRAVPLQWINLDDFVVKEINFNPKAESIAKILRDTNITAKGVVFVDDNPVERSAVKQAFPEIRVLGDNPFLTRHVLLRAPETQVVNVTDVSARREDMILKQKERESERTNVSREEFLKSLNCKVSLAELCSTQQKEFSRCFELINKSNQFNTTGKRWTLVDIEKWFLRGGRIFFFNVEDRFTDYGLVGVVIVVENEIRQFLMSCRVLGLDVEASVLRLICRDHMNDADGDGIVGQMVHTEVNLPARDLFSKAGFIDCDGNGTSFRLPNGKLFKFADHIAFADRVISRTIA